MKVWIKLIKHFQGGSHTDYMLVNSEDIAREGQQQDLMESWGEQSDGGHAYGYRVDMSELKNGELPPKEWLEKAVRRTAEAIKYLQSKTKRTKEELTALKLLLK